MRIDTFPFTRSKKPDGTCSGFSLFDGLSLICPHFQHLHFRNCGNVAPKADSLKEFEYYVIGTHSGDSLESFIELIHEDLWPCLPRLLISSKLLLRPLITSTASFPSQGWTPASPARLSLSSVDEATETKCSSSVMDEHQWMVSWKDGRHHVQERLEAAFKS